MKPSSDDVNMSWFDTSGIASIAKSALKEAQRTIDKALDIKDEDLTVQQAPAESPIDTNSEDFFGNWGVNQSVSTEDKSVQIRASLPKPESLKVGSSLWGSFTGSFFDASQQKDANTSVDLLDDSIDAGNEPFSGSKLVVQDREEISSLEEEYASSVVENTLLEEIPLNTSDADRSCDRSSSSHADPFRLSVISCESDKKSSESVEILGNNSNFTTTPDSELVSYSTTSLTSSAQGSKVTSASVEVLMINSVTSPSSIEVIPLESRRQSQLTDEFVSPLESPGEIIGFPEPKSSPESVEVIDDLEDNSYNSLSESTAATILEPPFTRKPTALIQQPITRQVLPTSEAIITRAPTRQIINPDTHTQSNIIDIPHEPDSSKTTQQLINVQPHLSVDTVANSQQQSSNVIDIPLEHVMQESDSSSQSERTLTAGEQSLLELSGSDTSTTTEGTSHLKVMLAEAMSDKVSTQSTSPPEVIGNTTEMSSSMSEVDLPIRDTSPLSSESRSDMVKIGSDHTSGHTSGDDLETTASSDIEIISSPNGDSSSTHSRHSPAKVTLVLSGTNGSKGSQSSKSDANVDSLLEKMALKKIRGHTRELSAASSISDDCEIERLIKRISEMTEILEIRETKLIDVNRRNAELTELNADLNRQLENVHKQVETQENVTFVAEEYTQRMSVLEKKFQQVIREKDSLRKQLDQSKQDAATRLSKGEMDTVLVEKEETIQELREEGEKLSKQHLQHSNIIKKLRTKEKEHETTIKHLKESIEDLSSETERLKRSLAAKEEVERSQIEAVHLLTSKNKKHEHDVNLLQSQVDDLTQKYDTTKKSFDAAKMELKDKNRTSNELAHRENLLISLEQEKRMTESQNEEIISQIEDLRSKLRHSDSEFSKKESLLRSENNELFKRLEDAESRNEELTQSMLETTKPLARQLENLQVMHNVKQANFAESEHNLLSKINDLQGRLQSAVENEKFMKDDCVAAKSKLSLLEAQLKTTIVESSMLRSQYEHEQTLKTMMEQDLISKIRHVEDTLKIERNIVEDLKRENEILQENLLSVRRVDKEERRKISSTVQHERHSSLDGSISPTVSIGHGSIAESLNSAFWPNDDPNYERQSSTPTLLSARCTNMLEMQTLQTNLKQRHGDLQQLQWEVTRRENERTMLNKEIATLLNKIESMETEAKGTETLRKEYDDMKREYEALCQLYGEKVEETEELRLDLKEVKEMYKLQLEELLSKQNQQV